MTKDERFLIALYKKIQTSPSDEWINPHPIGKSLGYQDHLLNNILRGLAQANLIKQEGPEAVKLTTRGEAVVKSLLQ